MEMTKKHNACDCFGDESLFRIGMFAAMNHVTVKALRFYEEQGLLFPAYINEENGYRYYRMNQMAAVHKITALKKAGFSLEDIAKINACSDEKAVLNKKKSDLLCKIAELTKQIAILDGYLANKGSSLSAPVLLKTIPEVTVAAVERRIESYDCLFEIMPQAGELMEIAECECQNPEYCFTNYLEPVCKEGDILVEICQAVTGMKRKLTALTSK